MGDSESDSTMVEIAEGDMITIKVKGGQKHFVEKAILQEHCTLFKELWATRATHLAVIISTTIDVEPDAFDFFLRWTKLEPRTVYSDMFTHESATCLIDVYCFGINFGCSEICCHVLEELHWKATQSSRFPFPTLEDALHVWNNTTESSPLRQVVIDRFALTDHAVNIKDKACDIGQPAQALLVDFFLAVIRRTAVVRESNAMPAAKSYTKQFKSLEKKI